MEKGSRRRAKGPPDAHGREEGGTWGCTALMGSMTRALQAQKVLAQAALHSEVIKISSSRQGQGCTYGITYSCMQETLVRSVLSGAGIAAKKYMGGSDG